MSETNSMASSQRTSSSMRSRVGSRFFHSSFPVFPTFMVLESSYHLVFTYAGMFIQFMQMLAFVLNPNLEHGETLNSASYIVYAFQLPLWDPKFISPMPWNIYLVLFCAMVVFFFLLVAGLLWCVFSPTTATRQSKIVVLVRAMLHSTTTILFIPILQGLMSQLVCTDSKLWSFPDTQCYASDTLGTFVMSIITLMVVSILTYITESTLFAEDYHSNHPLARKHYLNDVCYTTWRILSCVLFHIFLSSNDPYMYTWLPMYCFFSGMLMALSYVFLLPFISQVTTRLFTIAFLIQSGTAFLVFFSSQGALEPGTMAVRALSSMAEMDVDGLIFFAILVLLSAFGWRIADLRINRELIQSLPQLLDSSAPYPDRYTCMFPRGLPEYDVAYRSSNDICNEIADGAFSEGRSEISLETPFLTRIYVYTDVEVSTRFLTTVEQMTGHAATAEMLHLAARIFSKGMFRFQDSASVVLSFASMIRSFSTKASLALMQCEKTNAMACTFPSRYRAYRLLATLRMELHLRDAEYQRTCEEAKRAHKEILVNLYQFWNKLITHQDRSQLLGTYSTIARKREKTNEMFVRALQHQTSDRELLLKYADFLEQVMLQPERAERLRTFAKQEMEEHKRQRGRHGKLGAQQQSQSNSQRHIIGDSSSFDSTNHAFGMRMDCQNVSKLVVIVLIALVALAMLLVNVIYFNRRKSSLMCVQYSGNARTLRVVGDLVSMQYWTTSATGTASRAEYQASGTRFHYIESLSLDMQTIHNYLSHGLPTSFSGDRENFWLFEYVINAAYAGTDQPRFSVRSFLGLGYQYSQFLDSIPGTIARREVLGTSMTKFVLDAIVGQLFDDNTRAWGVNGYNTSVQACRDWFAEESNTSLFIISGLFGFGVVCIVVYAELSSLVSPVERLKNDIISLFSLIPRRKMQEIAAAAKLRVEQFDRGDVNEEDGALLRMHEVADLAGVDSNTLHPASAAEQLLSEKIKEVDVADGKVSSGRVGGGKSGTDNDSRSKSSSDDDADEEDGDGDDETQALLDDKHGGGGTGKSGESAAALTKGPGAAVSGTAGQRNGDVADAGRGNTGGKEGEDVAKTKEVLLGEYIYLFLFTCILVSLLVIAVYVCPLILNGSQIQANIISRTTTYNDAQADFLRSAYLLTCFFSSGVGTLFVQWNLVLQEIRNLLPTVLSYQPGVSEVSRLKVMAERVEDFSWLSSITADFAANPSDLTSEYDPAASTAPVNQIGEDAREKMFGAGDGQFLTRITAAMDAFYSTGTDVLQVAYVRSVNVKGRQMELAMISLATSALLFFGVLAFMVYKRHGKKYASVCNIVLAVITCIALTIALTGSVLVFLRLDSLGASRREYVTSVGQYAATMRSTMWPLVLASAISQQGTKSDPLQVLEYFDYLAEDAQWRTFAKQIKDPTQRERFTSLMELTLHLQKISLKLVTQASNNVPNELASFTWDFDTEPDAMLVRIRYPNVPLRYSTTAADLLKPPEVLTLMARDVVSNPRMQDVVQEMVAIMTDTYTGMFKASNDIIALKNHNVLICVICAIVGACVAVVTGVLLIILFFRQHAILKREALQMGKGDQTVQYAVNRVWISLAILLLLLAASFGVCLGDVLSHKNNDAVVDLLNARGFYVASGMVAGEMWSFARLTNDQLSAAMYFYWNQLDNVRARITGGRWNIFKMSKNFNQFMQGRDVVLSPQFRYGFNPSSAVGGNMAVQNATTWTFPTGVENSLATWMQQTLDLADANDVASATMELATLRNSVMPLLRALDESASIFLNVIIGALGTFLMVEVLLCVLLFIVVIGVTVFMLIPVARRHFVEETGYNMLIKLIPFEIRESVPAIREYMANGLHSGSGFHNASDAHKLASSDEITIPTVAITRDGIVIKFNRPAEEAFGYCSAEVLGNNVTMLMSERIGARHDTYLQKYTKNVPPLNRQLFRDRQLHGRKKSGELFAMRLTVHELRRGNGSGAFIGFIECLEERVRLEREEGLSSFILDNAIMPMIAIDSLGTILRFNRAAEECFGRSSSEVMDQNVKLLMPEDIAMHHDSYLSAYLRTRQKRMIDRYTRTRGMRKSGQEFPMEILVKEIQTHNMFTYFGIIRDLSADAVLDESISLNEALFEASVTPIICTDMFGKVILYSRAAERVFGYTAKEVVHNNCKMLMPETVADQHDSYLEKYRNSWEKRVVPFMDREIVGRDKDGRLVPLTMTLHEVKTSSAAHGAIVGFFQELTDQRSLESALEIEDTAAENHRDALVVISGEGIIQRVNRATLLEFGYAREELLHKNVKTLVPLDIAALHDSYLTRDRSAGVSSAVNNTSRLQARRKDGTLFSIEIRVSEVLDSNNNVTFVAYMRNLTKDIRMEQQLMVNKMVMDLSSSPILKIDVSGSIIQCNEATERMLKQGMEKLIGNTINQFFIADTEELMRQGRSIDVSEPYTSANTSATSITKNLGRYIRRDVLSVDQTIIPVYVMVQEVKPPSEGIPSTYLVHIRDVREEDVVKAASAYNASIAALSPVPFIEYSLEGRVLEINKAAEDQLEWGRKELLGLQITTIIPDSEKLRELQDQVHLAVVEALANGHGQANGQHNVRRVARMTMRSYSRREYIAEVTLTEVVDSNHELGRYVMYVNDITETLRLQAANASYSTYTELSPHPLVAINSAGVILTCNTALCRVFKYEEPSLLVGINVSALMPSEVAVNHDGFLRAYLKTRQGTRVGKTACVQCCCSDGSQFLADLTVYEVLEEGASTDEAVYIGCFIDHSTDIVVQFAKGALEATMELSQDPLLFISDSGVIERVNKAAAANFGYEDASALVGQSITTLLPYLTCAATPAISPSVSTTTRDHSLLAVGSSGALGGGRVGLASSYFSLASVNRNAGTGNNFKRVTEARRRDGTVYDAEVHLREITVGREKVYATYVVDMSSLNQLHAQRKLNMAVAEHTPVPLIVTSSSGLVQFFSPAAEEFFGYTASEVIGTNVRALLPEMEASQHDTNLKRYHTTGEKYSVERLTSRRVLLKSGEVAPAEVFVKELPLKTAGEGVEFLIYVMDRRDDFAVEKANMLARAVANGLPVPYLVVDERGDILELNAHAESMLGYRSLELQGQNVSVIIPYADVLARAEKQPLTSQQQQQQPEHEGADKAIGAAERASQEHHRLMHHSVRVLTKRGKQKEVDIRVCECARQVSVVADLSGLQNATQQQQMVRYLLLQDVSSALELARAQQRYNSLVQFIVVPVIQLRVTSSKELHVLNVNHAAERLLHWSSTELVGRPLTALIDDPDVLQKMHRFVASTEGSYTAQAVGEGGLSDANGGGGNGVGGAEAEVASETARLNAFTYVRSHNGHGIMHAALVVERVGDQLLLLHLHSTVADHARRMSSMFVKALEGLTREAYVLLNDNDHVVAQSETAQDMLGYSGQQDNLRGRDLFSSDVAAIYDDADIAAALLSVTNQTTTDTSSIVEDRVLRFNMAAQCILSGQFNDSEEDDEFSGAGGDDMGLLGGAVMTGGRDGVPEMKSRVVQRNLLCKRVDGTMTLLEARICSIELKGPPVCSTVTEGLAAADGSPLSSAKLRKQASTPALFSPVGASSTLPKTAELEAVTTAGAPKPERSVVRYFVVFLDDPSPRLALQSRAELADSILEFDPTAIVVIDTSCTVLKFNAAAERLFLFDRNLVIGKNVNILMPESTAQRHDSFVQQLVRMGKKRVTGFKRLVEAERRDGRRFMADLYLHPVKDDFGRIQRIVGYLRESQQ